jgi:hypothetical protein
VVRVLVVHCHQRQLKLVGARLFHWHTQEAGGVANDPSHPLFAGKLGSNDGVALILAVFVVGDQNRLAGSQCV